MILNMIDGKVFSFLNSDNNFGSNSIVFKPDKDNFTSLNLKKDKERDHIKVQKSKFSHNSVNDVLKCGINSNINKPIPLSQNLNIKEDNNEIKNTDHEYENDLGCTI